MDVLAIDIGGTNVKILASGQTEPRKFPSGPSMTPRQMVKGVLELAKDWKFEVVSIGYPGVVRKDKIVGEPHNLGAGWVAFDFESAFKLPARVINDAAMQALGSYKGGELLFLGLGTGLGSAMVVQNVVIPMELGHLAYRKGVYEDYVGLRGLERLGKRRWRRQVERIVTLLSNALLPDDVVLGGGNVKKLDELPPGCRAGDNFNAFIGGFRLWEPACDHHFAAPPQFSAG
jgi:predicted NBD/HSP70 family sugar kinase